MDAFYASVEQLDNPWLKGKCVIVGGTSNRGVVSAASYEARKYGVHSAMPVFQAKQKCPDGIFIPPRMQRYKEVSRKVMAILKEFTPLVEPVSIDEAYLDISDSTKLHGEPGDIAQQIKVKIKTASAASAGRTNGRTMCQKIFISLIPSSLADSINSNGSSFIKFLMNKVQKPVWKAA